MTRINAAIEPAELPDRLLLAEHRELTRIPNAVTSGRARLDLPAPVRFTLGAGHVRFFYRRCGYLRLRYAALYRECVARGFAVTDKSGAFDSVPCECDNAWTLSPAENKRVRALLIERIESKGFYLLGER